MDAYSQNYKRAVTLLLMIAYTFNAMDRTIISIIAQAIKLDLQLTDTQLGLLGGAAFALLYAFGGIPIARLAERVSRVNIIAVAMTVWSLLSALCGAAAAFPQLLLIRVGVGIAEAGCSPPAHSLISDYFEPSKRTSALSIYSCGVSLGYLLAAVAGGYVAQRWGWRAACFLVGAPGIAVAILIKAIVKEPVRGMSDPGGAEARTPLAAFSLRTELRELRAVAATLVSQRPVLHMILGVTIGGFAAYGFYAFVPAYFSRTFDLGYGVVGVIAGVSGGIAVGAGILIGGFLADGLAERTARWYALVPALGGIIAVPLYLAAVLQRDWRICALALSLAGFFQYTSLGPTFGVVQMAIDQHRRATATAFLYICLSVIALGGGPLFTGWTIDRFAQADFQTAVPQAGHRIDASFREACPGGVARPGSQPVMQSVCRSTMAVATRKGLTVTLLFFAWAMLHYFAAAAGMAKLLACRAQAGVRADLASSVQSDST